MQGELQRPHLQHHHHTPASVFWSLNHPIYCTIYIYIILYYTHVILCTCSIPFFSKNLVMLGTGPRVGTSKVSIHPGLRCSTSFSTAVTERGGNDQLGLISVRKPIRCIISVLLPRTVPKQVAQEGNVFNRIARTNFVSSSWYLLQLLNFPSTISELTDNHNVALFYG